MAVSEFTAKRCIQNSQWEMLSIKQLAVNLIIYTTWEKAKSKLPRQLGNGSRVLSKTLWRRTYRLSKAPQEVHRRP